MSRIVFSALGPTIAEQCDQLGYAATGMNMELVDRIRHALMISMIHGILTDGEFDRACNRLLKAAKLQQVRAPIATQTPASPEGAKENDHV